MRKLSANTLNAVLPMALTAFVMLSATHGSTESTEDTRDAADLPADAGR